MYKQITLFLFAILVVTSGIRLRQWPRFVGVKTDKNVSFYCEIYSNQPMSSVVWLKGSGSTTKLTETERRHFSQHRMFLNRLQTDDSGTYYCKYNDTKGPGSELQVHEPRNLEMTIRRSIMKDVLILIQALMLGIFLFIPLFCYKQQAEKEETIYEEPDMDHTYEGLDIDRCDLYEDIPAFSEQDGSEPGDTLMESPDHE